MTVVSRIAAAQPWLDSAAETIQPAVHKILSGSPRLRNVLDGRWLGAPLHPAATDVPIGAWAAAVALDWFDPKNRRGGLHPADGALAVGVVAALPTAVTGMSDWSHLKGDTRRIGSLHAALNSAALILNVVSLGCRLKERRGTARVLALAAFGITSFAAHAGGELSFRLGVRVNRTAWPTDTDDEWADVRAESRLGDVGMQRVEVRGVPVVLARSVSGAVCAIHATCSHMGGPLDEGEREGDTVICPWHGSRFDLCTGQVVDAPAVFPQPRYATRVRKGRIEVRPAHDSEEEAR